MRIKKWSQFVNEGLKGKLQFLIGQPINLIKRLHTTKWNKESQTNDKITQDENVSGLIGQIGDYEGYDTPGFYLTDESGRKKGFVMYDEKNQEFIEGDSTFYYTYHPKTDKDERTLQLIIDNLS